MFQLLFILLTTVFVLPENVSALYITADLESIRIQNVGYSWQTVELQNTYASPVISCTYNLLSSSDNEAAVRIQAAGASSFQIKIQQPEDSSAVTASDVYCLVADDGSYTLPDGRVFDAHTVLSDSTSGWALSWDSATTENVSSAITGTYNANSHPIVLGQVQTTNDSQFSVFWSFDCENRKHIPFDADYNDGICVGKHIGQINDSRLDETLGYFVIADNPSSASSTPVPEGSFGGIEYRVAVGADSVLGVGNTPPQTYNTVVTYNLGAGTKEAEDGGQGGWAVFYGADPMAGNELDLSIDEETVAGDTSRKHISEQVGYWLFRGTDHGDAPASYGDASHYVTGGLSLGALADAASDADAEASSLNSTAADGDDTDNIDDEDGVSFRSPSGSNNSIFADVTVNNAGGDTVTVCAWLDYPATGSVNGIFDAGDIASSNCQTTSLTNPTLTFQWSGLPVDQQYTTYARFRISTDALTANDATGTSSSGEVEDYQVVFDFRPTAVTIGRVELEALPVAEILSQLDIEHKNGQQLLDLLTSWNPEAAEQQNIQDRDSIINALQTFLDPDNNEITPVLSWDTLEERGTIGFHVERRLDNNAWVQINQEMLPGLINAPMGGEYFLADPKVHDAGVYHYRLIEIEARGAQHIYGPFDVKLK